MISNMTSTPVLAGGFQIRRTPVPAQTILQPSPVHSAIFATGDVPPHLFENSVFRHTLARRYSEAFFAASVDRIGVQHGAVMKILKSVHRNGIQAEFREAVMAHMAAQKLPYQSVGQLLQHEYIGNPLTRIFKGAPYKEVQDALMTGHNTHRGSAMQYRAFGMWQSLSDFADVCKRYPVMSAGVIGAVAYLGHRFPFLGGASGILIIGWGLGASAFNEFKAATTHKQLPGLKAADYTASGENLVASLITGVGIKGIVQGSKNGWEVASELQKESKITNAVLSKAKFAWDATKAEYKTHNKTSWFESFLFVSGLFDNVLLPFNWIADSLQHRPVEKKEAPTND